MKDVNLGFDVTFKLFHMGFNKKYMLFKLLPYDACLSSAWCRILAERKCKFLMAEHLKTFLVVEKSDFYSPITKNRWY